jgi:cysteine synthase
MTCGSWQIRESGIYDAGLVDRVVEVRAEEAQAMARQLARQEGLFVGISAGAAVVAALRVALELASGVVVALLPDGGFKYASAPFWAEQNSHSPHVR